MKKHLLALSLLAAFAVNAQTTVDSTSGSNSNAGAQSGSAANLSSQNSGNTSVTATGNEAQSGSVSDSRSGATSGSRSGAMGNSVYVDQRGPVSQTVNATNNLSATNTSNETVNSHSTVDGRTTQDLNVHNSGVVEQRASGGYTNTTNENINYSGTTTVKNVPSIAMSGPASGPCTGASGGLGLAGPGWGLGLNGSAVMVDCRLRENTRVLGMAMQSVDSGANPQEKGELMVMFMDAARALSEYNKSIYAAEVKK